MESKTDQRRIPQGVGIVQWPDGVTAATGISPPTLQRMRSQGNAPKLYAVSERTLVTTEADLLEWVRAKAVPAGYKCRPPVRRGRIERMKAGPESSTASQVES
ncbi:MAG: hypothetical protein Q8M01_14030 [Rubrivivax sp.]|nr:hypothetical protein [Rubrivivax sp.]